MSTESSDSTEELVLDKRAGGTLAIVSVALAAIVLLEAGAVRLLVAPHFAAMFEDFGATSTTLPTLTQLFIGWSGYVMGGGLAVLATTLACVGWLRRKNEFAVAGVVITALLALVVPALAIIALYLPIMELSGAVAP